MKNGKQIFAVILIFIMTVSLIACEKTDNSKINNDDTQNTEIVSNCKTYNPEDAKNAVMDFSVKLFQNSVNPPYESQKIADENVLISPTSVLTALVMTANGAQNETLAQMEEVFGITCEPLNDYMKTYLNNLPDEKKYKLHMANSIWIKDEEEFTVNKEFVEINKTFFDTNVYEKEFNKNTLREINRWVEKNTDGMIEEVLNEIPEDAVMYLINALAFEAEWEEIYKSTQIRQGVFTLQNDIKQDVEFMYSEENLYLEDEKATGFVKYYADQKYAFVALLPKEDVTIQEYVASMSGSKLQELLEHPQEVPVNAVIPKFEVEDDILLNDNLKVMGIVDAFDAKTADFTGIGTHTDGNLFINRVIHKTHMQVDEKGTKAGAATVVEVNLESAMESPDSKNVRLDRPFIYMIIDCENNQPIFMGTLQQVFPLLRCGVADFT